MKEFKFRITYVKGEEIKVKLVEETKEGLKEMVDYLIEKGYKILEVSEQVITINYMPVSF